MRRLIALIILLIILLNIESFLWGLLIIGIILMIILYLIIKGLSNFIFGKPSKRENVIKVQQISYDNGITYAEFEQIIAITCKPIKRIQSFDIRRGVVTFKVLSQSGISEWTYTLDFNDGGEITGRYWIASENKESNLPETTAQRISERIKNNLKAEKT